MEYIKSENYLCFATILEMILKDSGIHRLTRFDIVEELGIMLPSTARKLVKNAYYSDNQFDWGIRIDTEKLNLFFQKNRISFQAEYIYATPCTMIKEEVEKWSQCYVIFLFSYGELISDSELQEVGHAALFIDMRDSQNVCIYDPGPKDAGEKIVNCCKLEEAMYQRNAGYVLIRKL